jgi:hypothetical protein
MPCSQETISGGGAQNLFEVLKLRCEMNCKLSSGQWTCHNWQFMSHIAAN